MTRYAKHDFRIQYELDKFVTFKTNEAVPDEYAGSSTYRDYVEQHLHPEGFDPNAESKSADAAPAKGALKTK